MTTGYMREILVLGGEHGEERPGIELVGSLQENRIEGVEGVFGNWPAVLAGVRYIEENQALAHPGKWYGKTNESRLANRNIRLCYGFDLAVNVHSFEGAGGHYAFVGERMSIIVFQAIAFMGSRRILVNRASTHQMLPGYMPNCFGVELSKDSELRDIQRMRTLLGRLVTDPLPERLPRFEVFADMEDGAITEARARELGLPLSLPQCTRLDKEYAKRLGYSADFPLYAQDWHSDAGLYRGVLATTYDFDVLLQNLRTVDDCYDADYLDGSMPLVAYDRMAGAGRF